MLPVNQNVDMFLMVYDEACKASASKTDCEYHKKKKWQTVNIRFYVSYIYVYVYAFNYRYMYMMWPRI